MSDEPLYFDEIAPDGEWTSEPRTITTTDVLAFADLTGDRNPVHVDPEFARTTPFRRCIAHGMLGLSVVGGLGWKTPFAHTVAFLELREWHFRAPIFPGDAIRVRSRVREKQLQGRGRRGTVVWDVVALNQSDRVVQEGVLVTLVETARAGGAAEAA
ncbi:MAG: MaoC family dehydratase N-terminal domain-containing protein [Planctomycetes bacterium]|nr:MaoC family dehydratase N-terminal domain-containing protein [Planctomycetota bacterium]